MAIRLRAFNQGGATAVEYALLAGLIAVVIATAVAAFGTAVIDLFDSADLLNALTP